MKPILYNATETLFDSYGLGEMSANKATVTRERNGNYSLYIEYPVGGSGVRTKNQTFYISRIVKDSSHVIKIYAKHISHLTETMGIVHGTTAVGDANAALARWSESLVGGIEFRTWSDIETEGKASWTVDKSRTAREALGGVEGSILDVWGGEYEFDNTTIRLHKQLGRKTPTVLQYGRNILSAEEDENSESSYTSIYPYASYTPEADEGGRQAEPVFVTLPEKIVDSQWVKMYADRRVQVVDFSSKFTEKETPTIDKLRKMAERYVHDNRIGIPKTSIKVEYVDLTKTLDYADMAFMEEVELCDIVPIFYPEIGLTNEDGKVVVVNYDVLNDRNESIEIGTIGQGMKSAMVGSLGERLETLENRQIRLESNIPAYLLDGKGNKVWYQTPDNTREHKVGDTWFEKNGLYDRIYVWNGEMWEKRIDTEDVNVIAKEIDNKFKDFKSSTKLIEQKAEEALQKAGASSLLAQEAKRIGLDSVTKLEEFKKQATSAQTALSGDLDVLKQTVASEVNQASEYRRTTTEAFSRMTGQMNGFATKSEVKQGIDGLTETFSKMKVGGRNYAEDYDFSRGLWQYSQGDSSPQDWTILNGEYNVKGTTNTWKQMQIHSKEGSRASGKSSTALLELETGETYTLSFQGICYSGSPNVWVSLRANRTVPGNPEIINGNFNLTPSWQTYQVTIPDLTKPDNFDFWRIILGYNEIGHVAFRKVELTRSSTRIDAGPAPEDGRTDLIAAKAIFERTAQGLRIDLSAIQSYVDQDGQRQEELKSYARNESITRINIYRQDVARNYILRSRYDEDAKSIRQQFEAITNSQNGLIATKIADYKHSVDGKFTDISSQITTYKQDVGGQISGLSNRLTSSEQGTTTQISNLSNRINSNKQGADNQISNLKTQVATNKDNAERQMGRISDQVSANKANADSQFSNVTNQLARKVEVTDFQKVKETSQLYERILGTTENGITDKVARMTLTNQLFQIEVSKNEGLKTVQRQIAGSWAVQNINSEGDLISGINLGANGYNRFDGKLTHITGETLIDKAVIKDGMIANVSANKLTAGTIDARTVNLVNLNANNVTSGTFRGLMFEGGIIRGNNGNTVINLNDNVTTYNGYAKIEFKSPRNSLEFNSGGRKAFLAPTVSQDTNYAAFAFGVNDRGNHDPNRDFVGLKIFNQPDSRQVEIVGDLTITRYEEQGIRTTSLRSLFKLIDDNFKMLKDFRVRYGEGSPGFYDIRL